MYSNDDKIIIWLMTFDFMSYKKAKFVIDNFDDLLDFHDNIKAYSIKLKSEFSSNEINTMINDSNLYNVDRLISNYIKAGIDIVTIKSDKYPPLLKEIDSPPVILYCRGDVSLLKMDCLGVVGTRRATRYGKDVGAKFVKDIATENIVIVSGLAEGIDTVAHKSTLEVNGKTIAVLGGGINNIYPNSNITLANNIVEKGGLLVSEYKPNEPALTYHFPVRNRIIAGLSKGVFIVEATEKSGSMHTKNYALDYNREVFALPARVGDIYSVGCNKCIKSGQATMVLSSDDIISYFGGNKKLEENKSIIQLNYEEQLIYDCVLGHEKHFEEISKETNIETKNLVTMLIRMELKGIITKLPGNYYKVN